MHQINFYVSYNKKIQISMSQKQRSYDERQSRTHFYFVAPSLNTSFSVSASWQHVIITRNRSMCIGRRAYASGSLNIDAIATPVQIDLKAINVRVANKNYSSRIYKISGPDVVFQAEYLWP